MKVLFITAGPIAWASSRMRAHWIAPGLGAEVVEYAELLRTGEIAEADVYVWQKQCSVEAVKQLPGRHVWDVCDPMWWFSPKESMEILDRVNDVVACNPALASDFMAWSGRPCVMIPDRLNLEHYSSVRKHEAVDPVRFIWFGLAANRSGLFAGTTVLQRLKANDQKVELTVFDDRPDLPVVSGVPIKQVQWTLEDEVEVLCRHDIALLPPYPGPWGAVKSNNRVLSAMACGLPVTDGADFREALDMVRDPALRQTLGQRGRKEVELLWGHERSVAQWKELLGV